MKSLRICICRICFAILFFLVGTLVLKAELVTVSVKSLQNTLAVPVDSIIIINQNNNCTLRMGGLSTTDTIYHVDLVNGHVLSSTEVNLIDQGSDIYISSNASGYLLNIKSQENLSAEVNLYSVNAKKVYSRIYPLTQGFNSIQLSSLPSGVYILSVKTNGVEKSFKLMFNNLGALTSASEMPISPKQNSKQKIISSWNYAVGDPIQVIVRKGDINSLTWVGTPCHGSLICLALPKKAALFDMKQTLSSGAQINTISYSGVAFYSGCFYASTFYPPGKVADYFGFQYLRDNDPDESGHNTDFLTKAAYLMMHILSETQLQQLIDLAVEQNTLFNDYALKRFLLIKAFHRYLDGDIPVGKTKLNLDSVKSISRQLYLIDGEISYGRAQCFAAIINSFTEEQRDTLNKLGAVGMRTWPMPTKPAVSIPKGMNTWVMSNASEMFSWYLRGVEADVYFCPERQGTYFGGFFMKDAPAVGTPGYGIDMEATANKGSYMLEHILTPTQSNEIKKIYDMVSPSLLGIVQCRTNISNELRKALSGQSINKVDLLNWSSEYGDFDAVYIYSMVDQFVKVSETLTVQQKADLITLRDLDAYPCKAGKVFIYSAETDEPNIPNTDFLFE